MNVKRVARLRKIVLAVLGFAFCQHFCVYCDDDFSEFSSPGIIGKQSVEVDGVVTNDSISTLNVLESRLKVKAAAYSWNLFNVTRSESHNLTMMPGDNNITGTIRIWDLKVISVKLENKTVHIQWTSNAPHVHFDLRYHRQPEFLQQYFNSCNNDFLILNQTVSRDNATFIHILALVLPDELFKRHEIVRIYFAVKALNENRSIESDVSNVDVAVFTSPFLERILAAIVITCITSSVIVSISALIVVKLGLHRRPLSNRHRSDYYYDTVTEITVLENRNLILSNFDSRRISSLP